MDPIEEARAKAGDRLLVVDFYTAWCGPCRRLDQVTWPDPAVKAWLDEKAVLVKVDGEKHAELTERLKVSAFPTMILLKPDGTELDRLVGFRAPHEFLADVESALAGKNALARAREAAAGGGDPIARMDLGRTLAQAGRDDEALAEFLWCFDHGAERDPDYDCVRLSFLLGDLGHLARRHPPAVQALRERRDRAEDALKGGDGTPRLANEAARLNEALGEPRRSLALYDALADGPARRSLHREVFELLVSDGRFADAASGAEPKLAHLERLLKRRETETEPEGRAALGRIVAAEGELLRKALAGAGRAEEAEKLAERLRVALATRPEKPD